MFGSYFTNHKVLSSNSNGSLFVSRRQSNSKTESNTKEESSRFYNDQKQRNTSRKNSSEVRTSYSSLTISQQTQPQPIQSSQHSTINNQHNEERPDLLRNSFYNQKSHSNSAKQINDNGYQSSSINGGGSMFFQKPNFESKILQKKMNEGQLLSMQNQKTFTVGNYNTGTTSQLNISKFKIMLEQSNSLRTSSNHQQFFKNDTDRYNTENKETIESFSGNGTEQYVGEKENNKYFFSQFTKKNRNTQEYIQQNINQTPNHQGNEVEECTLQVLVKSPTKNVGTQQTTTCSQNNIDSANMLEPQQKGSSLVVSQKSKNLQELLKYETEKDANKSIGSGELGCAAQKHMSSQQLNDFFNSKKSLSPRKVVKETTQIQSPQYRHQNSERKPIINSPDIKSSKSFENVFNNNSAIQKFTNFHQNLQALTSNTKPKQQATNANGSLQSSFQVKNELAQSTNMDEKQSAHYFTKDQDTVINSAKKQSTHQNNTNLAGSIVNLKKSKKKAENQAQNTVHSSQDSELSLLRMENYNLKNQNQLLAMKNETLEKEKKHYKNNCTKKQQEVDLLTEQLNQLRNQIDQMKIQIKLSTHSQESTLIQKPLAQTLLSTHNMSSQETPRQLTNSTNNNNNNANLSTLPHFQPSIQSFTQQSNLASFVMQQNNNNYNQQFKQQLQCNQNTINIQQQQSQQQLIQQHQLQQQQQNPLQAQYLQQQGKQGYLQQQNQQYHQQMLQNEFFNSVNTQSPQKNYLHGQSHKHNGLSPIVNSEERSDFVSNSILEDIPTTQSQIRTINNSLVIHHSHANDDFEIIQNEYIPSHNSQSNKNDTHYNTLQHTQNLKF